jgi:hypothetical protein
VLAQLALDQSLEVTRKAAASAAARGDVARSSVRGTPKVGVDLTRNSHAELVLVPRLTEDLRAHAVRGAMVRVV